MKKQSPYSHVLVVLACTLATCLSGARAGEFQSLKALEAAAVSLAKAQEDHEGLVIQVRHLDRRLKLPACAAPLHAFWPPGARRSGRTTVGVTCKEGNVWKVYVPLQIKVVREVVLLGRDVARGEILSANDFVLEERDIASEVRGYVRDPGRFVGHRAKRRLSRGEVLTQRMVVGSALVRKGEMVTIVAKAGGIQVHGSGVVLKDAMRGHTVRVRSSSGRVIEAEVVGKGMVQVHI